MCWFFFSMYMYGLLRYVYFHVQARRLVRRDSVTKKSAGILSIILWLGENLHDTIEIAPTTNYPIIIIGAAGRSRSTRFSASFKRKRITQKKQLSRYYIVSQTPNGCLPCTNYVVDLWILEGWGHFSHIVHNKCWQASRFARIIVGISIKLLPALYFIYTLLS